jgi:hypothetical protein
MSRAAFTFKTKAELKQLDLREINAYIHTLRLRTSALNGAPLKVTEKHLVVALRVRDSLPHAQERGDA